MITITLPEPLAWLIAVALVISFINDCLGVYLWYLKRQLAKMKDRTP